MLPDLILLDGGRGQLGAGIKALEDLGLDYLPLASLAKRAEEVYTPDRLEPLVLDLTSPALQALQKIRDEAHRFAITYHKKLRQPPDHRVRARPDSRGGARRLRTSLLKTLGSAKAVREASVGRPRRRCRKSPRSWRNASMISSTRPLGGGTLGSRAGLDSRVGSTPKGGERHEEAHDGSRDPGSRDGRSPALANQCPLLIKQIQDATAGKTDDNPRRRMALANEAKALHDSGKHAESVAKADEAADGDQSHAEEEVGSAPPPRGSHGPRGPFLAPAS